MVYAHVWGKSELRRGNLVVQVCRKNKYKLCKAIKLLDGKAYGRGSLPRLFHRSKRRGMVDLANALIEPPYVGKSR